MSFMDNVDAVTTLAQNNKLQLLTFKVSSKEDEPYYGINVFKTREVIKSKDYYLTELIGVDPLLEGTIVLRGIQVPILDLPAWLNLPMTQDEKEESFILICDFNSVTLGFRIHGAYRIIERQWTEMKAPDGYNVGDRNLVINDTRLNDGSLCLVLDYERLLAEVIPAAIADPYDVVKAIPHKDIPKELLNGLVLIAEDSKMAQKHIERIFLESQINFQIFPDGKQLVDYILSLQDNTHIKAVITDIEMPQMSGFTVTKVLKGNPKTQHIPLIINSSMTGENNKREALSLGADGYIPKVKSDNIVRMIIDLMKIRNS